MEIARRVALALEDANAVATRLPNADTTVAAKLARVCKTHRNYYAWGSLGPDLFMLMPDYAGWKGHYLRSGETELIGRWQDFDGSVVTFYEDYITPFTEDASVFVDNLTANVLSGIEAALGELVAGFETLAAVIVASLFDWFGVFGCGPGSGVSESLFYWSDMTHYRRTFEFAHRLYANASKFSDPVTVEKLQAFALGWATHCAADTTGHPFINMKVGGPYRIHWLRHHLVEQHIDAQIYDTSPHHPLFADVDTSALHFRLAFRDPQDGGPKDAPAYDYFQPDAGITSYTDDRGGHVYSLNDMAKATTDAAVGRHDFYDMDMGPMPADLSTLIIETMKQVYPATEQPQILAAEPDPSVRTGSTGIPSGDAIANTFWMGFQALKEMTIGGRFQPAAFAPADPGPPAAAGSPAPDDGARGGDTDGDLLPEDVTKAITDLMHTLRDVVDGATAAVQQAEQAIVNGIDQAVGASLEALFREFVFGPFDDFYRYTRQLMTHSGFIHPRHDEIDVGLVQLGVGTTLKAGTLDGLLASVDGWTSGSIVDALAPEPSGRPSAGNEFDGDGAYPRALVADPKSWLQQVLGQNGIAGCAAQPNTPTEFLAPWHYPDRTPAGNPVGFEAPLTHAGPYLAGQDSTVLAPVLYNAPHEIGMTPRQAPFPGDAAARADFESAASPAETESRSKKYLPQGKHLGDPVDYGMHVVWTVANAADTDVLPSFNLDADRGYAWHSWDYDRSAVVASPKPNALLDWLGVPLAGGSSVFDFHVPCNPPEGFCPDDYVVRGGGSLPSYSSAAQIQAHYVPAAAGSVPTCSGVQKVDPADVTRAGMTPDGTDPSHR